MRYKQPQRDTLVAASVSGDIANVKRRKNVGTARGRMIKEEGMAS